MGIPDESGGLVAIRLLAVHATPPILALMVPTDVPEPVPGSGVVVPPADVPPHADIESTETSATAIHIRMTFQSNEGRGDSPASPAHTAEPGKTAHGREPSRHRRN